MENRPKNAAKSDGSMIAGASRMTCNGRVFAPAPLQKIIVEEVS